MRVIQQMRRGGGIFFLCVSLLGSVPNVKALETDQYDLSPVPLSDIGDEVSDHVEQVLREAIARLNQQIERAATGAKCYENKVSGKCEETADKLAYLRSSDAVAQSMYDSLGKGIPPFSVIESWMDKHRFQNQPARYKVGFWKSIFFAWPVDAFTNSPTVRLYGSEFGTDKFGHIFQQGYSYYQIYKRARAHGCSAEEAHQLAIDWGQKTERTIYGKLVTLVYSNGDLLANYVGLKFYQGLTEEVKIGASTRPPIVILKHGYWDLNPNANLREVLLRPFISDHLNEALNPSIFTQVSGLHWYVRRKVAGRSCQRWFDRYPNLSRAGLEEIEAALQKWHGESYGFTDSEHFITIANTCFDAAGVPRNRPEIARRQSPRSMSKVPPVAGYLAP